MAPPSKTLIKHSSSFEDPNSFSSVDLLAVSRTPCAPCLCITRSFSTCKQREEKPFSSLVGHEDLEAIDDLGKRDGPVLLPALHGFNVVNKDDKVFVLALVVHLSLLGVSARHDDLKDGCLVV